MCVLVVACATISSVFSLAALTQTCATP
jgi:hypothetical protein